MTGGAAGDRGSGADADAAAGRVVVLDLVGLQAEHVAPERTPNLAALLGDRVRPLKPPFPAVTVTSQTTLATGRSPAAHGDVCNGAFDRESRTVEFWGRDAGDRGRLWEVAREAGVRTGALFFQHLKGTDADVAVTPSPIEDENNDLLEMHCWTNPDDYYADLRADHGHFPLHNYWGPMASAESSRWILTAAGDAVRDHDPDMLWVYVPHLDYAGLEHGPGPELDTELGVLDDLVGEFLDRLRADERWAETAVVVASEYGFHAVDAPAFPNRALREAGLLETKPDPKADAATATVFDLDASRAFAMVDHQVAHVYCDAAVREAVRDLLADLPGVDRVLAGDDLTADGLDHPSAGDLVLVAERNAWFSYQWWSDDAEEPHYATDVDIHEKPGFDPCELFLGDRGLVSTDATLVGGSHGRVDPEAYGVFGVGGPAAPALAHRPARSADSPDEAPDADDVVDARSVAPTVADLLGTHDDVAPLMGFERPSVFAAPAPAPTDP